MRPHSSCNKSKYGTYLREFESFWMADRVVGRGEPSNVYLQSCRRLRYPTSSCWPGIQVCQVLLTHKTGLFFFHFSWITNCQSHRNSLTFTQDHTWTTNWFQQFISRAHTLIRWKIIKSILGERAQVFIHMLTAYPVKIEKIDVRTKVRIFLPWIATAKATVISDFSE